MTINIFVSKGDLNGKIVVVRFFFFLSGLYKIGKLVHNCTYFLFRIYNRLVYFFCTFYILNFKGNILHVIAFCLDTQACSLHVECSVLNTLTQSKFKEL